MNRKYLVAAALLIVTAEPLSAQSVRAGIDAWQRSDYAGAVAIWRPLAEKGDPDAEFNLGQAYRLGRGVPINLAAAKTWFERAAGQGHIDAETTLGLMLFQNGDQPTGLKWLKKAADQGEARALLVYGTALVNGDSIPQDPVLGYAYVARSAAQGLEPAKDTLQQLDQLLPLDQRKRGVAIARQMAKGAPAPSSAPVKTAPKPVQAATVKAAPTPKPAVATGPAIGAWQIQVGAFDNRGAAETAYGKLAGNAALAGRSPQYIPFKQFIRLRIGPFVSKESAAAACGAVHVPCFPVRP